MLFFWSNRLLPKAGRLRAGLPLRSNVVGTYGSPTNAPSLYTRTPIARELLPAGAGSFYLLKLCSRVSDCYSCFPSDRHPLRVLFIWSNRLLPKAGRLQAGVLHIQREHCALPFCRDRPGSPERCSPQERFPPQTPRDLRSQTSFAGRLRAGLPLRHRSAQMW